MDGGLSYPLPYTIEDLIPKSNKKHLTTKIHAATTPLVSITPLVSTTPLAPSRIQVYAKSEEYFL